MALGRWMWLPNRNSSIESADRMPSNNRPAIGPSVARHTPPVEFGVDRHGILLEPLARIRFRLPTGTVGMNNHPPQFQFQTPPLRTTLGTAAEWAIFGLFFTPSVGNPICVGAGQVRRIHKECESSS